MRSKYLILEEEFIIFKVIRLQTFLKKKGLHRFDNWVCIKSKLSCIGKELLEMIKNEEITFKKIVGVYLNFSIYFIYDVNEKVFV